MEGRIGLMSASSLVCQVLLLIAALTPNSATAQSSSQESAFSTIIEGTLLRTASVTRFADLLRLVPAFTETSLDGFQLSGSLGSTSPYRQPRWRVSIDGREINRPWLWSMQPELLPVPISSIARVVIDPLPGPGPGGISAGGWIRIETIPVGEGVNAAMIASVGNEAGDPGPFRYTELATPNVDRIGPTADGRLTFASSGWWTEFSMRADQSHPTDERIIRRVQRLFAGKPLVTLLHPQFQVGVRGPSGEHRLVVDASLLRDMLFLPAIGAELPVTLNARSAEAFGQFVLPGRTLRYAFATSRLAASERANRESLDLHWASRKVGGRLEMVTTREAWGWHVAAQAWYSRLSSEQLPEASTILRPELEVGLEVGGAEGWSNALVVQAGWPVGSSATIPSVVYELVSGLGPTRFSLRASFLSEAPDSREDESFWLREGWDYPGQAAGRTVVEAPSTERILSVDAGLRRSLKNGASWGVFAFLRSFSGLNLSEVSLIPDSLSESRYLASRVLSADGSGQVKGARAWYRQTMGRHMWHRLDYAYRLPTAGGDLAFWQAWSPLPRVEMRYILSVEAVPRTTLLVAARFRTSTSWPSIATGPFTSRTETLPASVTVDLTITKRLWGPRMRAFVVFRNLTGGNGRTHPLGADQDLTFVAGLSLGAG